MSVTDAAQGIARYAYGMDTNAWDDAVAVYADEVDIDYRQVGAMQQRMSRAEVRGFLQTLLGKPDLRVHTAISQVLEHPDGRDGHFVAYYSVRHYKGDVGSADRFVLFGWYDFTMTDGAIDAITVNVSATEGDPAVLA